MIHTSSTSNVPVPTNNYEVAGVNITYEDYSPPRNSHDPSKPSKVLLIGENHQTTKVAVVGSILQNELGPNDIVLIEGSSGSYNSIWHSHLVQPYGLPNTQSFYGWDDSNSINTCTATIKQIRIFTSLLLDLKESKLWESESPYIKRLIKHIDSTHIMDIDQPTEDGGPTIREILNGSNPKAAIKLLAAKGNEVMEQVVSQTFAARNQAMIKAIDHFNKQTNINRIFVIAGAAHLIPAISEQVGDTYVQKGVTDLLTHLEKQKIDYQVWRPLEVSPENTTKLSQALELKKRRLDSTIRNVIKHVASLFVGLMGLAFFPFVVGYYLWKIHKQDIYIIDLMEVAGGSRYAQTFAKTCPIFTRKHPKLSSQNPYTIQEALRGLQQ